MTRRNCSSIIPGRSPGTAAPIRTFVAGLAAAALLSTTVATAAAGADPAPAASDVGGSLLGNAQVARDLRIAARFWGRTPGCPGAIKVNSYVERFDDSVMRAVESGCQFWIEPTELGVAGPGPARVCTLISHEYGHLLGYVHVADPRALMNHDPANVVPACNALGSSTAARAGHRPASKLRAGAAARKRTASRLAAARLKRARRIAARSDGTLER